MKNQFLILLAKLQAYQMKVTAIISAFFLPIFGILILIAAAVLLDTITGIWKSKKLKLPITSRKMSAVISKVLLYEITIMLFYCIDVFILNDIIKSFFSIDLLTTKVLSLVLISIELISINENYKAIKGLDLWQSLKNLFARAQEVTKDFRDIEKRK